MSKRSCQMCKRYCPDAKYFDQDDQDANLIQMEINGDQIWKYVSIISKWLSRQEYIDQENTLIKKIHWSRWSRYEWCRWKCQNLHLHFTSGQYLLHIWHGPDANFIWWGASYKIRIWTMSDVQKILSRCKILWSRWSRCEFDMMGSWCKC